MARAMLLRPAWHHVLAHVGIAADARAPMRRRYRSTAHGVETGQKRIHIGPIAAPFAPDTLKRIHERILIMNQLSPMASSVLAQLRFSEQSAAALAKLLDVPAASIRRSIQELRAAGYNVAFASGNGGPYRLME